MRTPLNPSVQNLVFPLQMVIDCEWISQCLYFLKINRFLTCLWMFKSHYTRFFCVSCQIRVWAFRTTSVRWAGGILMYFPFMSFHIYIHWLYITVLSFTGISHLSVYRNPPVAGTAAASLWSSGRTKGRPDIDAQCGEWWSDGGRPGRQGCWVEDDPMIPHTLHDMGHFCGNQGDFRTTHWDSMGAWHHWEIMGKNGIWEGSNGIYIMAKIMVTNGESMTIMNT